jgi:hypothetical protein
MASLAQESAPSTGEPSPVLIYLGPEFYSIGGKDWVRYKFAVENFAQYPKELFAPAPSLPPCGMNTKSARTWVDLYAHNGNRLYGFCALASPSDLNTIYFALEQNELPPSWVYMEMTDRQTSKKYRSNLTETTQ